MKTNTCVCVVLRVIAFYRALHVIQANTLVYDRLEGCEDLVDTAQGVSSDPGAYANKTYRDMNDFKNYPDKSKEPQKDYTWTELITLDGENGHHLCLVIDRNVYDFTDFADQHPAGPKGLKKYVGCDADHGLQRCGILPGMIKPVLQLFKIGQLAPSETDSYAYDDQGFSCDSRN